MSTYLLAWTVVNSTAINSSTSTSARGLEIQTFYKNATVMEHADLICAKQPDCFEQNIFVGINYNLFQTGQDIVPEFALAAMENWEMFTFQTNVVLYAEAIRDKYTVRKDNTMAQGLVNLSN